MKKISIVLITGLFALFSQVSMFAENHLENGRIYFPIYFNIIGGLGDASSNPDSVRYGLDEAGFYLSYAFDPAKTSTIVFTRQADNGKFYVTALKREAGKQQNYKFFKLNGEHHIYDPVWARIGQVSDVYYHYAIGKK